MVIEAPMQQQGNEGDEDDVHCTAAHAHAQLVARTHAVAAAREDVEILNDCKTLLTVPLPHTIPWLAELHALSGRGAREAKSIVWDYLPH